MRTPGPLARRPSRSHDVSIPTPTHAERARTLVAGISTGTLCTLALEPEGYPYGSFVTVAFDHGNPIFLISELAEHTKNLERDPRVATGSRGRRCRSTRERPRHYPRTVHAGRGGLGQRAPHSSPLIRTRATTLISATSRSGSCKSITSATSGAMAGCHGSARLTGAPPNRIPRSVGRRHDCSHERRPR